MKKTEITIREVNDNKKEKTALGVTTAVSAGVGTAAGINYAMTPQGMDKSDISRFLPTEDTPLSEVNFIEAHNAFTDYDPMGNQQYSATWLLDNTPTRAFQLDIKQDEAGNFFIEHDLHLSGESPSLEDSLRELDAWLEENPDQVIMIDIDANSDIRKSPELAAVFEKVFGDKLDCPGVANPDMGDLTDNGTQIIFRQNNSVYPPEWSGFTFVDFDHVYASNDSVAYDASRGIPCVDNQAFIWSDNESHFVTSEQLQNNYDNSTNTIYNLDQINKYSFNKPEGFESDPTIGSFKSSSLGVNTGVMGLAAGNMAFSIVGPAAALVLQHKNIQKTLDAYTKDPSSLSDKAHRQLLFQNAKMGIGATSSTTNALVTAAIMYPGFFDPLGIAAVATAGTGLLGTMLSTRNLHWKLKNISDSDGVYQLWPESEANKPKEPEVDTTHKEADITHKIDRTQNSEKLEKFLSIANTLGVLTRFTNTTKYVLPAIAPVAAGVGVGLMALNSGMDGYTHNKMINDFIENPEKAVDYFKSKSIQNKRWMFWGHSKITRFLDNDLKNTKQTQKLLENITEDSAQFKNGRDVLKLLTLSKEDYLLSSLHQFLKKLTPKEKELIYKPLQKVKPHMSGILGSFIDFARLRNKDEAINKTMLHRLTHITNEWNILNGKNKKGTLSSKEAQKFKTYNQSFKGFWEGLNSIYVEKNSSHKTFQESFIDKLEAKQEYLSNAIESVSKKYEEEALIKFSRRSGKVPKWLSKTIEEYVKSSEEYKKSNSIKDVINAKIKEHYSEKTLRYPKLVERNRYKENKAIEKLNYIVDKAVAWKIKSELRHDIRKHGYRDTAQIAVGVGSMGLVFPAVSGLTFTAALGTMAVGSVVTEIVARKKANKWENKYNFLIESQENKEEKESKENKDLNESKDSNESKEIKEIKADPNVRVEISLKDIGTVVYTLKESELYRMRKDSQGKESLFPINIDNNGKIERLKFDECHIEDGKFQLISKSDKEKNIYELSWDKDGKKHLSKLTNDNRVELKLVENASLNNERKDFATKRKESNKSIIGDRI